MNNYNLHTNFQPLLKKAIKKFLSADDKSDSDKTITTSLRLSSDLKQFYENLAEAESTSLNTAIINTLSKVKECTISHYKYTYDSIEDLHLKQVNSLIKIIDISNIDLNDLDNLFEWLNGRKPEREELIDKRAISKLFNKESQKKLCKTFGYNYRWLSNNQYRINEMNTDFRWYKNLRGCISKIIYDYYLNSSVSSLDLGFIVSDMQNIENIYVNKFSEMPNYITPFLIVSRNINGINVTTYHHFESSDINYERCRNYFIMLVKMSLVLQNSKVLNDIVGYLIPHETHDKIQTGDTHLSEVFGKKNHFHQFHFDDFDKITPTNFSTDKENKTMAPNVFNMLSTDIIGSLAHEVKNDKEYDNKFLKITDTRIFLNQSIKIKQIPKYLNLYANALNIYMDLTGPTLKDPALYINKLDILKIHEEVKGAKSLETSF